MSPSGPPKLVRLSSLWSASCTTTSRSPALSCLPVSYRRCCVRNPASVMLVPPMLMCRSISRSPEVTHTRQLEQALTNADFHPDSARVWRWETRIDTGRKAQVKFELLADLADQQQGAIVNFDNCQQLGAANGRNKPKDWYDLAYVLLHNDDGPTAGADAVTEAFGSVAVDARTWL